MKKRGLVLLLAALLCVALGCFAASASVLPLDVGNFNDYNDGGGGEWGGDDSGWDWGGDSSDSGTFVILGGGGTTALAAAVVVVVIVVVLVAKRKSSFTTGVGRSGGAGPRPSYGMKPRNNEEQIVAAVTAVDENFSRERFIAWSKEVFITLQQAWTARDWSRIRSFEKEELFRQHELQLQQYIDSGRINIMNRINVNTTYLNRYSRDAQYEYMTVYMETRMCDYIIDEKTKQVLKGDPNRDCYLNYLLTFMRRTGVKTNEATSNKSTVACPHCGAPLSITSAGKCDYCGFIITTGEHDWVLSDMTAVRPDTPNLDGGVFIDDANDRAPDGRGDA